MPLNGTREEQVRRAALDEAAKMRLESRLVLDLRGIFRDMSEDIETGVVQVADSFRDDFLGVFLRQGRRVSREFSGHTLDYIAENEDAPVGQDFLAVAGVLGWTFEQLMQQLRSQARTDIQQFTLELSKQQANYVTRTNQKEIDTSMAIAKSKLDEEEGPEPTVAAVAALAAAEFRERAFNRAPTISATYTQVSAEGTKSIERQAVLSRRNGFNAALAGIKPLTDDEIWVTVGDEVVRPAHVEADGQVKKNGTFVVKDQLLRFPGDTSLGATLDNTVNCRCSAVMRLV